MSTRDQLAQVIRDGEGTWRTPLDAADAIIAAGYGKLDAVLALCVTSEEHAAQFGDVPSVYVDDIRAAVNDALEGK